MPVCRIELTVDDMNMFPNWNLLVNILLGKVLHHVDVKGIPFTTAYNFWDYYLVCVTAWSYVGYEITCIYFYFNGRLLYLCISIFLKESFGKTFIENVWKNVWWFDCMRYITFNIIPMQTKCQNVEYISCNVELSILFLTFSKFATVNSFQGIHSNNYL